MLRLFVRSATRAPLRGAVAGDTDHLREWWISGVGAWSFEEREEGERWTRVPQTARIRE